MKTQINSLVKGDHRLRIAGTNSIVREAVALKVRQENPETMTIRLRGRELVLTASYSISGKTVDYSCEIPIDLYVEFFGSFGIPEINPKAFITIHGDCTVWFTTNSKKSFFNYIPEAEIEIL